MKQIVNRIQLLRAFLFLVNDPRKTDQVFRIADLGRAARGPLVSETLENLARDPALQKLFTSKYNEPLPALTELAKLPDGTFGREFARHMIENGLDPNFFPIPEGTGIEQYAIERGRKQHDLWHVLTGFDTSVPGEIGLQAFTLAQIRAPFSAILIAGGLLHVILKAPVSYQALIDQLFEGYQMGVRARRLLGVPLEPLLNSAISEVREQLEIVPHTA